MALEHLLDALEREAQSQAQERLEGARRAADALLDKGRARMARERTERLGALEAELRDRSQTRLLDARRVARRKVLEARQGMFDRILREALRRLPEAQRTQVFQDSLPGVIAEALKFVGAEPVIVSCPAALGDEVRRALGNRPGVTVRIDPATATGVRVETADGGLIVDCTLEGRLEQLRPHFLIEVLRDLEEGP